MPTKLNDWMPEKTESGADWELWRAPNLPNRSSATTRGQRSAAQNGQYSEPDEEHLGPPAPGERRLPGEDDGRGQGGAGHGDARPSRRSRG